MTVNERVRDAIDERGLKQKFVAKEVGVTDQAFSAMMTGKQKIDIDVFFSIARVLQMDPEKLYRYEKGAA